jgi:uncharacterized membrane protein/thiol-disulfide isomerase/thioredoxin
MINLIPNCIIHLTFTSKRSVYLPDHIGLVMKFLRYILVLFFIGVFLLIGVQPILAQTPSPNTVVHAVLFYSPSCGHCQYVITEALPPIFEKYGDQLSMVGIDISQSGGHTLFLNTLKYFNLEQGGVPFLVVGDTYLIGSVDIPDQFPGLIEKYLAQGGLDWPTIPGLAEALITPQPTEAPSTSLLAIQSATPIVTAVSTGSPPAITPAPTTTPGLLLSGSQTNHLGGNFANDPLGNSLSIVVLVGMILSLVVAIVSFRHKSSAHLTNHWNWAIPILCIIGLGVAGYLAYVETTQVEAVCGPVGDCNSVQQSEYARLFGILPIGILGMAGYVMILLAWVIGRSINKRKAAYASMALLGMNAFGVVFSIYLTFLEPFVIGATCAWCLSSAIIMTALFLLSLASGKAAYIYLLFGEKHGIKRSSSSRAF